MKIQINPNKWYMNTELLERGFQLYSIMYGVYILYYGQHSMFGPGYVEVREIMSSRQWGVSFVLIGMLGFGASRYPWVSNTKTEHVVKMFCCLSLAFVFGMIVVGFYPLVSTAIPNYVVLMLMTLYCTIIRGWKFIVHKPQQARNINEN